LCEVSDCASFGNLIRESEPKPYDAPGISLMFWRPLDDPRLLLWREMFGVGTRHGDDGFAHFYLKSVLPPKPRIGT
jgi:hypothetical protein